MALDAVRWWALVFEVLSLEILVTKCFLFTLGNDCWSQKLPGS